MDLVSKRYHVLLAAEGEEWEATCYPMLWEKVAQFMTTTDGVIRIVIRGSCTGGW